MISDNTPVVRVTQIEAFRRYLMQSEYDNYEITEQSVIDSITEEFKGNELTRIGTAFHSIVESGHPDCQKVAAGVRRFLYYGKEHTEPVPSGRAFNIDDNIITLDVEQCKVALAYRDEHPNAFHEVRSFKDYGEVVVTGQADMIDGLEIRDIKTKFSPVRDSDYINSCQWRFYLDIFGADIFHFDIFSFEGYRKEKHSQDVRGLPIVRHLPSITCLRYTKLQEDNEFLLGMFIDWARQRNLMQYFKTYKQWKSKEE